MEFKLANLAQLLKTASERGYGDLVVSAVLPVDIAALAEPVIVPAQVKRNESGRWWHPAFPEHRDVTMGEWLRQRGFDFTVTYLIKPDDATGSVSISGWPYMAPTGDRWFCWEINTNADGEAVAVWIAPTE